jgi:hypothetical protein
MPSIDEDLLIRLCESGKLVCLAEQNNGYIFQNLLKILYRRLGGVRPEPDSTRAILQRVLTINTLDANGRPQFIHSGTYEELTAAFGLTPPQIATAIERRLKG